jgi:dienelactone hydrolase
MPRQAIQSGLGGESVIMDRMPTLPEPKLRGGRAGARRAVLILHGGREHGLMPTSSRQSPYLRMLDFYLALKLRKASDTAVYLLRYRVRGWNPERHVPDPVADARWALDRISAELPGAPIAILGHSMGGRTAFAIAEDPRVIGVCALAPWLPEGEPLPPADSRARFVIAHGTADPTTSARLSLDYALRLRAQGSAVARFELLDAKHALLDKPRLWRRFAVRATLGLVGDRPMPPSVERQFDNVAALDSDLSDAFA